MSVHVGGRGPGHMCRTPLNVVEPEEEVPLPTPTLTWTSGTAAYDPTFSLTLIAESDVIELQIDDNSDFSSLYGSETNTVDAAEALAGTLTFSGISTLGYGVTYYARARYTRGAQTSPWSNTVSQAMDAADTTPNAFTFTDATGVATSSTQTSNTITVAGLPSGISTAISITGGTYSKNGGSYTSSSGTVVNGDTITVRHTASASNSTATNTVLTIGGVSDTYTSTTTSGAFTPAGDVTSTHWWDASYAAGVTGSAGTFSIADRIGSAALVTTSTNEPGTTKTINSNTAYVFDGTDRMWTNGIADLSSDTFHIFMVGEIGAVNNSSDAILAVGDVLAGTSDHTTVSSNSSTAFNGRLTCVGVGTASFNLTGGPYSGLVLVELIVNAATGVAEVFINGTSRGSGTGFTGYTATSPSIMIFSNSQGLAEMGGAFCEMVVCNTQRTGADLTAMRGYFNTKWGV